MTSEFPEEKSKSISTGQTVTFNPNIPRVTSINGFLLIKEGWQKIGNEYTKGENKIRYDGTNWFLNGTTRVWFMQDLNEKK